MDFNYYIYLFIILAGIVSAAMLMSELGKSVKRLPGSWRKFAPLKAFRLSICFLMIYLITTFISELISCYLATHGIYNHFAINIGYTLSLPFLFGFFFIHTQTKWKRYSYVILYLSLIIQFVLGGYYYPDSITPLGTTLYICSIHFITVLLHLTYLLLNPKISFFNFQLQINLSVLFCMLLSTFVTTFHNYGTIQNARDSDLFFHIQFYNMVLFYLLIAFILAKETVKLRRESH